MPGLKPQNAESALETVQLLQRLRQAHAYGGVMAGIRPLFHGDEQFPHFVRDADGCRLTDLAGREFIDWTFAGGAVLLGYRRPEVEEAICRQMASGPTVTFTSVLEVELAEMLVAAIPSVDCVAFGKNGSDATTAAVRIARAVTGREVVLFHGFHSFHDWYAATGPGIQGIPSALRSLTLPFPYNDVPALERLLEEHAGTVAAIVMEPTKFALPEPGYLEAVRALATRSGALLIFDEIVTSLRLGLGGAQELFGVMPDLTCVGKALANGMPISVVGGRRDFMRLFPHVGIGMTFQSESLSMAAAKATLEIVKREPVAKHVAQAGEAVRAAFLDRAARLGFEVALTGHPSRMTFAFPAFGPYPSDYLLGAFITGCLERGVITNGTLLASHAHDEDALARTIEALTGALHALADATVKQSVQVWALPGNPGLDGYVEDASPEGEVLRIRGWVLIDAEAAEEIACQLPDGTEVAVDRASREDVAAVFPHSRDALPCGFSVDVPIEVTSVLLTIRRGEDRTHCALQRSPDSGRLPGPVRITPGGVAWL